MTEETPIDPLPGEGPPQSVPPAGPYSPPFDPLPGEGPPQSVPPAGPYSPPFDSAAAPIISSEGLPAVLPTSNERTMAMLCHLSAMAGLIGIPFGHILGPLVVWLIKRDESAFVDDQGKEALNFQITTTIYLIVFVILSFLLIGIPLLIALVIFWLVIVIVASVQANEGKPYRYPLTIRFIN